MMKKSLSIFLVLVMVLSALPLTAVTSFATSGLTINVTNDEELKAALDMNVPVDVINITQSFTLSEECFIMYDPAHLDNYCNTEMIIAEGVTLTIAEGGNLGSLWPSYEGDWQTPPLPNSRIINNGAVIIENGGKTEADFDTNNGTITVKAGGKAVCVSNNNGTVTVESGASYLTTQGDRPVNNGTITVQEGAVMQSRFGSSIINETGGTINLDGDFYCGCVGFDNVDACWFENKGTVTGRGNVFLYEADGDIAPVGDMDGLIETVMTYLGQESRFENWDDINIYKSITASDYQQLKAATTGERVVAGENVPGDMDTIIEITADIEIPQGESIETMAKIVVPEDITVTVNSGALLQCGVENNGIINVRSGGKFETTQGGNIENRNVIVIEEGAYIKSQMGGQIINCEGAVLTVNGEIYCGFINYDNTDHAWFENNGEVCGDGKFYLNNPENDEIIPASEKPDSANDMVNQIGETAELSGDFIQLSHMWGPWCQTTAPGCEDGEATATCEVCGATKTKVIPARHTPGEWEVVKEATCSKTGLKKKFCTICGEEIASEIIPVLSHTPGEWVVTKEATYTSAGEKVRKCTKCGKIVKTAVIPKLIRNGWFTINGYKFYYNNDKALTGWQTIKNSKGVAYKYYFNSKGVMLTGWQSIKNSKGVAYKYYFGDNGYMRTGWQTIKNAKGVAYKYYFGDNGYMRTGWQTIKNAKGVAYRYYFHTNGVMLTGWQSIKNSKGVAYKYYFGTEGYMRTGWQSIKNSKGVAYKYYFGTEGYMRTGWQSIKNSKGVAYKYYFGTEGYMRTGWQSIKNSKGVAYKYYFGTNGVMVTGWQTIKNSKGVAYKYCFNPNGTLRTGWQKMHNSKGETAYFYFGTDGAMRTGWQTIKNSKGVANKYYFGTDGRMRTGWQKMHNEKGQTAYFYFGTNGVMVANKSLKIGKKTYKFDKNGVCTNI